MNARRFRPPPAFPALTAAALALFSLVLPSSAGPLLPDLQGNNLTVPKGTKNWGSTFTLLGRIWNAGKADAGPFEVRWFLSKDSTGSSDDLSLSLSTGGAAFAHGPLEAMDFGPTFMATLRLPTVESLPPGFVGKQTTFYLIMKTDAANQVAESDESDNFGQAGNLRDLVSIPVVEPAPGPPPDRARPIDIPPGSKLTLKGVPKMVTIGQPFKLTAALTVPENDRLSGIVKAYWDFLSPRGSPGLQVFFRGWKDKNGDGKNDVSGTDAVFRKGRLSREPIQKGFGNPELAYETEIEILFLGPAKGFIRITFGCANGIIRVAEETQTEGAFVARAPGISADAHTKIVAGTLKDKLGYTPLVENEVNKDTVIGNLGLATVFYLITHARTTPDDIFLGIALDPDKKDQDIVPKDISDEMAEDAKYRLVFINGCASNDDRAQAATGFADAFRATAYVGYEKSIPSGTAHEVAKAFFAALDKGENVGDAAEFAKRVKFKDADQFGVLCGKEAVIDLTPADK